MLKDQKDLLRAFNAHGVEYLVVGGHAVGFHSEPRGTKDLDVWIRSNPDNAKAVFSALREFGAPLSGISPDDFNEHPETVFQVGMPPSRINVLQDVSGLSFEEAWQHRVDRLAETDLVVHVISKEDLIRNKEASGRFIDLADVEKLKLSGEEQ